LGGEWCRGADLNRGTTKDKVLSLAPLAGLGYPCRSCGSKMYDDIIKNASLQGFFAIALLSKRRAT
jgi:hypothetical protein